jgi:hypothetical protein
VNRRLSAQPERVDRRGQTDKAETAGRGTSGATSAPVFSALRKVWRSLDSHLRLGMQFPLMSPRHPVSRAIEQDLSSAAAGDAGSASPPGCVEAHVAAASPTETSSRTTARWRA